MTKDERDRFVSNLQEETVTKWASKAHSYKGVFELGTGVGKTKTAIMALDRVFKHRPDMDKIVISVPKRDLIKQWWEQLNVWGKNLDKYHRITIETHAATYKRKANTINFIIFDEFHNILADNYIKILRNNNLHCIVGLSATLTQDKLNLLKDVSANTIRVVMKYNIDQAQDDGVTAKSKKANWRVSLSVSEKRNYDKYSSVLSKMRIDVPDISPKTAGLALKGQYCFKGCTPGNSLRIAGKYTKLVSSRRKLLYNVLGKKEALADLGKYLIKHKQKAIVFGELTDTLVLIQKYLTNKGIPSAVYHGKMKDKDLENVLLSFKNNDICMILTAKKFNEGVDMPEVEWGIEIGGNSSVIQNPQRIGRIIRYKEGKIGKFVHITSVGTVEQNWIIGAYKNLKYKPKIIESFEELIKWIE